MFYTSKRLQDTPLSSIIIIDSYNLSCSLSVLSSNTNTLSNNLSVLSSNTNNIYSTLSNNLSSTTLLNDDTANQTTIVAAINNIITTLKNIYQPIIIMLALLYSSFTYAYPKLEYFDYDGTNVAHKSVVGSNTVFTANEIYKILNSFNCRGTYTPATNRYPLFQIELNTDVNNFIVLKNSLGYVTSIEIDVSDSNSMSQWISFELKASTNNFRRIDNIATLKVTNAVGDVIAEYSKTEKGLSEEKRVLYWCGSDFNAAYRTWESYDTMRKYVCEAVTNYCHMSKQEQDSANTPDPRSWKYYETSLDLNNMHHNRVMVLLDYTKFTHTKDSSWCNDHNNLLVWSYARFSATGIEKDDLGNPVWRPILPIKWYKDLPTWSYTNNEIRVISEQQYKETR